MDSTSVGRPFVRAMTQARLVQPWALMGAVVALVAAWLLRDVLLLVFASILLAVVLRGAAGLIRRHTGLPATASLTMVFGLVSGGIIALGAWQGPRVSHEFEVLRQELPAAVAQLRSRLSQYETAQQVMEQLPSTADIVEDGGAVAAKARSAASTTAGVLASFGLWLFLGVLLAIAPRPYVRGIVALVPRKYERRVCRLLSDLRRTLWWWSLGRLLSMTFVGVVTGVALALMGIPLAFLLGLIAALLTFVPNIGPIIAAVPAILLALASGLVEALWVAALYVGVQVVQGALLDPVIDRKTVYLPPALTVIAQVALGTLTGLAGVALAAPLAAVALVVVSTFWVQGALGKGGLTTRR